MSIENLSEENVNFARDSISDLLGLRLSNDEAKTLLNGESISFQKLSENRSLSEVGMALIRADAASRLSQECEEGCWLVKNPITGKDHCVCVRRRDFELSLHQRKS